MIPSMASCLSNLFPCLGQNDSAQSSSANTQTENPQTNHHVRAHDSVRPPTGSKNGSQANLLLLLRKKEVPLQSASTPQAEQATNNSAPKATLSFSDDTPAIELPIIKGTIGPEVIDIRKLYAKTGKFTFDPGFMSTAACKSSITYINGEEGVLLYRGYPIEQLAVNCNFEETCFLLLNGELPDEKAKENFVNELTSHTKLPDQMPTFFSGFRRDAHPMDILVGTVGALASFHHDTLNINDPSYREQTAMRLIAKMPTLVAMTYRHLTDQAFIEPRSDLSYSANFMRMMFTKPGEEYQVNHVLERALDRILILHADHEQNASTSTVRLSGSSGANPVACIAAGIACLGGPSHGGANEAALNMLKEIGSVENIPDFVDQVKSKKSKLMGFGHRVYKNYDPRAKLMRETCHEVLKELKLENDALFKVAMTLEDVALKDSYFVDRKLYPNVDFYSGIVQSALGIPPEMFTGIFAMARTAGWITQWREMISDPEQKIGRPRQLFLGSQARDVTPKIQNETQAS